MNEPGLTDEVRELRARVERFLADEIVPAEEELSADDRYVAGPLQTLKDSAKRQGLWALGHPTDLGGGGVGFMPFVYLSEVMGRSEWGYLAMGAATMQSSIMLSLYATEEQKDRWLRPLVDGSILASTALTEPDMPGSDPTMMQTHARLEGDEWVINGHKWFVSSADQAAFTTVFCRTEHEDTKPHRAFSSIIVPTDAPGYEIVRRIPTIGTLASHCEVRLTDVRVPADHLLGGRGEGFMIAQKRLGPGRIFHCMRWLGQAQRAFDLMCDRAKTRHVNGGPLGDKGEIQRYIAESAAEIQAARLMTLDAARLMDSGEDPRVAVSLIKFWGARMLHNVIDRAIQVHGALGVSGDVPLERMYRNARYARIYDGPDEVHRSVVARRLLDGAPKPWAIA